MAELADLLSDAIRGVVGATPCIYLAGPLSGGAGDASGLIELENRARMTATAANLRRTTGRLVIDPSAIRVAEWSGAEHGDFYIRVMLQFSDSVWLMPGWEFSRGATKEYLAAQRAGIECYDLAGRRIERARAMDAVLKAAAELTLTDPDRAVRLKSRVASLADLGPD